MRILLTEKDCKLPLLLDNVVEIGIYESENSCVEPEELYIDTVDAASSLHVIYVADIRHSPFSRVKTLMHDALTNGYADFSEFEFELESENDDE